MFNFDLSQDIEQFILSNSPCKEYEIIQYLQKKGRLKKDCMADTLSLFRCHYLIFNALYRLQILAMCHGRYQLSISSLEISATLKNTPHFILGRNEIAEHDPLCLFYLDTSNLSNTSETDIENLLNDFWTSYFNDNQKQSALDKLGLTEPVDFKTIKQQYRRLAMQHHPDRGGNADTLIEIHQAMQCLQHCYH
jgi:hypothetical protein